MNLSLCLPREGWAQVCEPELRASGEGLPALGPQEGLLKVAFEGCQEFCRQTQKEVPGIVELMTGLGHVTFFSEEAASLFKVLPTSLIDAAISPHQIKEATHEQAGGWFFIQRSLTRRNISTQLQVTTGHASLGAGDCGGDALHRPGDGPADTRTLQRTERAYRLEGKQGWKEPSAATTTCLSPRVLWEAP